MKYFFLFVCFILSLNQSVLAQFDNFNFSTSPTEVYENKTFTLTVELIQGEQAEQAVLFYRLFGTSEFLPIDMMIQGNKLISQFEAQNVIAPSIECYVRTVDKSGTENIFPARALETMNFIRIDVRKKNETDSDIITVSYTHLTLPTIYSV